MSLDRFTSKNTRRPAALLPLFISILFAPACTRKAPAHDGSRSFTDEAGRVVRVRPRPERIVSLAPSVTETLFALGVGDRTVGVTDFCDYPPEAARIEKIGDTLKPSIEKILALKADLVIASTASQLEEFVRKLDELGVPVYVSNPHNLEGVLESIRRIGELTDAADQGRGLVEKLRARIEAVRNRVSDRAPPSVFFVLGNEPLITVGGTGFINDMIDRAGGRSISRDEKSEYPQYSLETAIARQPEVIFLQSGETKIPERLKKTPAARGGKVVQGFRDL